MPNSNHYVVCPYFVSEKNESISCEDCFRTFNSRKKKEWWMKNYCDTEWEECPYAGALNQAYEEGEISVDNEKINSLEKELRSMSKKLGREKKKTERQQKRIDDLMLQKKELYAKWRKVNEELTEVNMKIYNQMQQIVQLYEDRMAYLIDTKCDGELREKDVEAWAEGKEFAIVHDYLAEERIWKVLTREENEEDETDGLDSEQKTE